MRKNIKNDKVIKAITIGLATMITATSAPVSILADEVDGQAEPAAQAGTQESNESQSENTNESTEAAQTAGNCADMASTDAPEAAEAVSEAAEAVENITDFVDPADQAVATQIQTGLEEVSGAIEAIGGQEGTLTEASALIGEALVADINADQAVDTANDQLAAAEAQQTAFAQADTKIEDNSRSAIDNADVANTSNDRVEAYQAKDDAEAALEAANDGLTAATQAYDETSKAVSAAEDAYNSAVDEQKAAADKLAQAKEALKNADTNATAANERMKALQSQMDNLNSKVEDLANQKEDLEKLNDLYYKLMVHFYRDQNIRCAVYNDNGTLNVEASAQKAKNVSTKTATENTFKVGRALMAELIEFKLKANGVDPSTIHIGEEVAGGTKKTMSEGALVKDGKNDKVSIVNEQNIWFADYGKGNDGRGNAIKVTYKDKDGNDHTEYYNYVLKSKDSEKDLENGPIYLAKIDITASGEDMVSRDTDANNMDDLRNLNARIAKAMKAAQILDEYAAAKAEVDEAAALVDELTKAIDTLNKTDIKISAEKVENLGKALEKAQQDLQAASDRKAELEDKVAEAQAAVDAIDLSRFDISDAAAPAAEEAEDTQTAEEAGTTDGTAAPAATFAAPAEAVSEAADAVLSEAEAAATEGGASAAAVLGARVDESAPEAEEAGENERQINIRIDEKIEEDENANEAIDGTKKNVRIADNMIPLAQMPSETDSISWWWLLIIALFGATGKAMYENYKNRKEEEAQTK